MLRIKFRVDTNKDYALDFGAFSLPHITSNLYNEQIKERNRMKEGAFISKIFLCKQLSRIPDLSILKQNVHPWILQALKEVDGK